MHTLLIILIVLLVILIILLGIVTFAVLSAFFAVQPILNQLGKISMLIEVARFVRNRIRRVVLHKRPRTEAQERPAAPAERPRWHEPSEGNTSDKESKPPRHRPPLE